MSNKLFTFDAFNTLFHLKYPVTHIYSHEAMKYGIHIPTTLDSSHCFKTLFHQQSKLYPNFIPDSRTWWRVLLKDYLEHCIDKTQKETLHSIFDTLFDSIYASFGTHHHFKIYPDVLENLKMLKNRELTLGIISNSDKRTISILESFELISFFDFIMYVSIAYYNLHWI